MLGSSLEMGWRFRVEIRMRMGLVRIKGVRIWELITAVLVVILFRMIFLLKITVFRSIILRFQKYLIPLKTTLKLFSKNKKKSFFFKTQN
jgi:hypothetical protein